MGLPAKVVLSFFEERVMMNQRLIDLYNKCFLREEKLTSIRLIVQFDLSNFIEFDRGLGGVGIFNVNNGNTGAYDVRDRDIYRPYQYILSFLEFKTPWLTRGIIQKCGLHLESIVKRITGRDKLPLGQALSTYIARQKIGVELVRELMTIVNLYNNSKHKVNQPKDTHLFCFEEAIVCYLVTRKLSNKIIPFVKIHSNIQLIFLGGESWLKEHSQFPKYTFFLSLRARLHHLHYIIDKIKHYTDHEKMGKGITLSKEEVVVLNEMLNDQLV